MFKILWAALPLFISSSLLADANISPFISENPIDEEAAYVLNESRDRTSWIIKEGRADTKVTHYDSTSEFGPGYVIKIDYDMDVRFKGKRSGTINLLVPQEVFVAGFLADLESSHPKRFGGFDLDFHGRENAKDANDRNYNSCTKTRIFNVNPNYRPINRGAREIIVLSHESQGFEIKDLEINMKIHNSLPVLGAVQLDVSGMAAGISFRAGFDYLP